LLYDLPALEQLWILLSIVIVLLLIFNIEGAKQAVWLLPIVVMCYAVDNYLTGTKPHVQADVALFPSEQTISNDYLYQPLSANIFEQQQQLQKGWQLYLIREWAQELPSEEQSSFDLQAEKGEFAFTLARLDKLNEESRLDRAALFHERKSWLMLLLYLIWNLFFAYQISRS